MQSFLGLPVTMSSIRMDDNQLIAVSQKARRNPTKEGYLCRIDTAKGKRGTEKWCVVYCNMLFYFDSMTSLKPAGVIFLEERLCRPAVSDSQSECPPGYDVEVSIG